MACHEAVKASKGTFAVAEDKQGRKYWFGDDLNRYLLEKGFDSIRDARGLGLTAVHASTDVLERDTVVYPRFQREPCIGCGRCVISCADGGHQAISLDRDRKPVLNLRMCVGCHLCVLVCPTDSILPYNKRREPLV